MGRWLHFPAPAVAQLSQLLFEVTTTGASQTATTRPDPVNGETIDIDWGDGSSSTGLGTGNHSHVYAAAGTYTVTVTPGPGSFLEKLQNVYFQTTNWTAFDPNINQLDQVVRIDFTNCSGLVQEAPDPLDFPLCTQYLIRGSGVFGTFPPDLRSHPSLVQYNAQNCAGMTGTPPLVNGLTTLSALNLQNTGASGALDDMAGCPNFTQLHARNANITSWPVTALASSVSTIDLRGCALDQASVDAILAALVAANRTTGTRAVRLSGGTNAPPSAAGLADAATLQGIGWTVDTN